MDRNSSITPDKVFILLAAYFALNFLARLLMPASLELDEAQQLFYSQWLSLGYDSQPPFYNWVQYAVVALVGPSVVAVSLLKNTFLFLSYLFYGLTALLLLRDRSLAMIATLGLLTVPQISFEAQRDLTHTVAIIFAACLFLYGLVRTLKAPHLLGYVVTGAAIGIGMISKYNFVLLPASALIAILPEAEFRKRLFDWRILVTAAVAILIVAPHMLWFLQNMEIATARTLGKLKVAQDAGILETRGKGLLSLALALLGFTGLTFVLFGVIFRRRLVEAAQASNEWTRLVGRMMLIILILLACMVIFGGATHIKDRWLTPFLLAMPLYLCLKVDAAGGAPAGALKRSLWISLIIMGLIVSALSLRAPLGRFTGEYEKQNVPYGPAIARILSEGQDQPSLVVVPETQLAGNIRLNVPDVPVMIPAYATFTPAYVWDATHPILLVWRDDGEETPMPGELADWLKGKSLEASSIGDVALPYHYGREGDLYHFGYAWVYPPAAGR